MPAGGWGGGMGGIGGMGAGNPLAGAAGAGGMGGGMLGNVGKALAMAGRGRPGMAEGGQPPGGSAIPREPARADLHRLLTQSGAEPSQANISQLSGDFDPMGMPASPFQSTNPRLNREMTHPRPARAAIQDPGGDAMRFLRAMGEENPMSAPMGNFPYNRTGVTPYDPFGLKPDPNDPSLLARMRTDPQAHRAMDKLLFMLSPPMAPEGSAGATAEEIIRLLMGAPNIGTMTYPGSAPDQANFPIEGAGEALEHKRKHGSEHASGHGGGGEHGGEHKEAGDKEHEGKIHVKEHWRGGRAKRKHGGVVKKALSTAKRHRKVAGRR